MNRNALPRKLKIALYSHDSQGLGHARRNLSITEAFSRCSPCPSTLLIVGAREAALFDAPRGVDFVSLPAISKGQNGKYTPRSFDVSLEEIIAVRGGVVRGIVENFLPDVFIVDKHPMGLLGELKKSLAYLCEKGGTRCIFGLRDVLDHPAAVWEEWHRFGYDDVISSFFDEVWVYGDPRVYDPIGECGICQDVDVPVQYTGYLGRSFFSECEFQNKGHHFESPLIPPDRFILCMVGGGQDGYKLAEAFLEAELPPQAYGVLVTGPFMPSEEKRQLHLLASHEHRIKILEFSKWPELLLKMAWKVVSMGGYNTICEILSSKKHALIVPRVKPRREQFIRARRLQELDLLDMLPPADLTPAALSEWFARDIVPRPFDDIDLLGAERLPLLLADLVIEKTNSKHFNTGVISYGII